MQPAPLPPDESGRIATLHALGILDTEPEQRYDRLTRIARTMFSVPVAVVSLVDMNRQWFKSKSGLQMRETPRYVSFCAHAILQDEVMCVEDALADERFCDSPLVTGEPRVRFFAGCPLRVGSYRMGTFCIIDHKPRKLSSDELKLLKDLAAVAEQNLLTEYLALTDVLTRLANRRGFEAFSRQVLAVCRRLSKPATLVYFDLNGFKSINDRFGHAEGDRALRAFAGGLESVFRESDTIARLGGDEFVVLLTDTTPAASELAIARLRTWIDEDNKKVARGYEITFSVGWVEFNPSKHECIDDLLVDADAAMYRNKGENGSGENGMAGTHD
jgi:diguanylate cyclase (GGDEF)-like protein